MKIITPIFLILTLMSFPAHAKVERDLTKLDLKEARQDLRKGRFGLKGLFGAEQGTGLLIGGTGAGFMTETFYLGGGGYGGWIGQGGMGYGGLLLGAELNLSRPKWLIDPRLLIGWGGGRSLEGEPGGSLLLEPSLSFGFIAKKGYRVTLDAGYLYFTRVRSLSGVTVGLHFEAKTLLLSFAD